MASVILKYNLEEIEDIIFKGFDYRIPDDVMEKISNLSMQVGSPDYIKTPYLIKCGLQEIPCDDFLFKKGINFCLKKFKEKIEVKDF